MEICFEMVNVNQPLSLFLYFFFLPWFGGGFNLGSKDNGERGKKEEICSGVEIWGVRMFISSCSSLSLSFLLPALFFYISLLFWSVSICASLVNRCSRMDIGERRTKTRKKMDKWEMKEHRIYVECQKRSNDVSMKERKRGLERMQKLREEKTCFFISFSSSSSPSLSFCFFFVFQNVM